MESSNSINKRATLGKTLGLFLLILLLSVVFQVLCGYLFDLTFPTISDQLFVVFNLTLSGLFIITSWAVVRVVEGASWKSLGFHSFFKKGLYFKGWLLGTLLLGLVYIGTVLFAGVTSQWSEWHWIALLTYLFAFSIQGLGEEVLCRGYLMNRLSDSIGPTWAIVMNALLFSLLHLLNPNVSWIALVNVFLAGFLFSVLFYYSGSIWFVGAAHSAWNFMLGPVLGVNVSGNELPHSLLITQLPKTKALLHGGDFGLEGGLVTTFVLLSVVIGVVFYNKKSS